MYELLRKVPLLAGLSDADFAYLYQEVEEVRLSAGEELFADGSPGDRAYVGKQANLNLSLSLFP